MTTLEKRCIILFVKCPQRGKVKSRLSPALEEGLVVSLYEAFVADLLETIGKTATPFRIAFTPEDGERAIVRRFGGWDRFPQKGADLGERMRKAFERCFADGYEAVVLIGSDIPDLPPEAFAEAFGALQKGRAVIGPTIDGGYCLIGFRRDTFAPGVFEGIAWSSSRVLAVTLEKLAGAGIAVHQLPPWRDVDTPEDLRDLWNRHRDTPFARSRTMALLGAARPAFPFGGAAP
jgi:uncharacterized protein